MIGKSYRVLAGIGICYAFSLGYILLAGIAYISKNWVYTQIAISAPALLFLIDYWYVKRFEHHWFHLSPLFLDSRFIMV